jgi:anaerobic selenocysteine-containing dehydrogenase
MTTSAETTVSTPTGSTITTGSTTGGPPGADQGLEKTVLPSACPLDCPDHCSLDVTVRNGAIVRIEGSRRSRVTNGFICAKVRDFGDRVYGPHRLLQPAIRTGPKGQGAFRPATWDEALDHIAARLRSVADQHGPASILPLSYGGSNGMLTAGTTDVRLFRRLGAAELLKTVCAAPTGRAAAGLYGKMPGVAFEDYVEARLIVVWGANPSDSGIHLVPFIREAQARGAKLVVVDPRRTPLAKKADLHLTPRPGTDLPLALAVIRWLFEHGGADHAFLSAHATGVEALRARAAFWSLARAAAICQVDAAAIERFARDYATTSPAVIRSGWGQERNRNGGSATAAILALPAVAGKFGVRGGGYTMSNSSAWKLSTESLINADEPTVPTVNMNQLGRHLIGLQTPNIHALFVYNANPLATLPDQERVRSGLLRDDLFTVVFEQVMTDTARYADVLLPATTFLEHREIQKGYGALSLQDAPPVIAPQGEARPNLEVFADLTRRLGLERPGDVNDIDSFARHLENQVGDRGAGKLGDGAVVYPRTGATPIMFRDHQPGTRDGKIHLFPLALDEETPRGLYVYQDDPTTEDFPLVLISPATRRTISSTLGELYRGAAAVELHPDDATARGLATGDPVRVWNALGEVHCELRVSRDQRPGVAFLAKGLWAHNTANGATANALAPDTLTDLGGGACFNDARVEIARRDDAGPS